MDWVAEEDVQLPPVLNVFTNDFLYAPGKELQITSHEPPQPFGQDGLIAPFDEDAHFVEQDILNARSPSDHVFTEPPVERLPGSRLPEGADRYFAQKDNATLVITKNLAVADGSGAQIVLCKFKRQGQEFLKPNVYWNKMGYSDRPTKVVAKIYDPLFYFKVDSLTPWVRNDVVNYADNEYANEAAAYAEFHEAAKTNSVMRDFVPRFYGTWTTIIQNKGWGRSETSPSNNKNDNTNGIRHERRVRIILLEHVEGVSIWDICDRKWKGVTATLIPPTIKSDEDMGLARRLGIFANILHGLVALEHIGVLPLRHKATNFIVACTEPSREWTKAKGKIRVVMVSHGCADLTRYTTLGPCEDEHFPRPRHPICSKYNPDKLCCLAGWFPEEWQDDRGLFLDWAQQIFPAKDFTCRSEIKAITDRLIAEWVPPEPKNSPCLTTLQRLGLTKPPKSTRKLNWYTPESDKDPPKSHRIRDLTMKEPDSTTNAESMFGSDIDPEGTVSTRRTSSSHSTKTSGSIGLLMANKPTAKEAGRRTVAAGITTLVEAEGGEEGGEEGDEAHEADDEDDIMDDGSPEKKTSLAAKTGKKRARESDDDE